MKQQIKSAATKDNLTRDTNCRQHAEILHGRADSDKDVLILPNRRNVASVWSKKNPDDLGRRVARQE